jgi:hypothetical protein
MVFGSLLSSVKGLLGNRAREPAKPSTHYHITNPYHAVSVVPCPGACPAARGLKGKRFLSREAPSLPLANCSVAGCRCAYRHHDDRRAEDRRGGERRMGQAAATRSGPDRRRSLGRRVTDLP